MNNPQLQKCDHYFVEKKNKVFFSSHTPTRRLEILDLVHFYLCGPMQTITLGGHAYFVTFIDDHLRVKMLFQVCLSNLRPWLSVKLEKNVEVDMHMQ